MERNLAMILLFTVSSTLFVANVVAQEAASTPPTPTLPQWPPPNVQKCWSSFESLHQCFKGISSESFWWFRHPLVVPTVARLFRRLVMTVPTLCMGTSITLSSLYSLGHVVLHLKLHQHHLAKLNDPG